MYGLRLNNTNEFRCKFIKIDILGTTQHTCDKKIYTYWTGTKKYIKN